MKLKKLLAAVTAAALAVSTMAVSSFTASAASLATVPEGTREVLAAAEVNYAPTGAWDNGPWTQINNVKEEWMTDENVYVEAKFSNLGGADGDDGEQPFESVKSWATILKWYNNNKIEGTDNPDTSQNFDVAFTACEGGTADECFAYAPISDFKRANWGGICGNIQSGHIKGFKLASLSIVKFTASSEEKHDYKVELDKETATVKAEETVTIKATVKDGDKAVEDAVVTWSTSDEAVATVKDGVVTGVKAGEATIKASYKPEGADKALEKECTVTVTAKEEGGDEPPVDDKSVTGSETLTGSNWWAEKSLTVAELLGDLDKTKTTITFTSDDDIIVGYKSKTVVDESADDPNWKQNTPAKSVVISSSDIDFDNFMLKVCVSRNDDKEVTINWIAKEGSAPVEPEKPTEPTSKVLWEGNVDLGTDWSAQVDVPATAVKAGDKINVVFDLGETEYWQLQLVDDNWTNLTSIPAADFNEYGCIPVTASPYVITLNETDASSISASGMHIKGYGAIIKSVELVTAGGTTKPDDPKPDDPKPDDPKPEDPKPDNTVTTPSDRVTYPVVIPFGYTPATSEDITNAVSSTAEGDTASVNLTSNTRVDKAVLDTIAGKDITVEFKLKGGAKWVINGKNVEKAKKVDLGVRLRSKAIPAEKVSTVAGENKTVQFSLRHNGDLGFTGALIIPFSSAYNGKFANLYYNNTAKDELEFVGSSKISAGQASFIFTHASDYVVVIDDEAYGEDVSSAAGVYETSEMTAAPYVAAVAVIAVLGAAAVVIKKRFAK